jgi:hypothetical protein
MMSVPAEGAERLAEILREIFALSEPNRPNRSKSIAADDPIKLLDTHGASGIHQTCHSPTARNRKTTLQSL